MKDEEDGEKLKNTIEQVGMDIEVLEVNQVVVVLLNDLARSVFSLVAAVLAGAGGLFGRRDSLCSRLLSASIENVDVNVTN